MGRIVSIALSLIVIGGSALAQEKKPYSTAELQALLGKGLTATTSDLEGGKTFTARITLAANGQLTGTLTPAGDKPIAVAGQWKLKGGQICRTLAPIQPDEICETWLKSGPKEAIVQVDGKEVSINRWQ